METLKASLIANYIKDFYKVDVIELHYKDNFYICKEIAQTGFTAYVLYMHDPNSIEISSYSFKYIIVIGDKYTVMPDWKRIYIKIKPPKVRAVVIAPIKKPLASSQQDKNKSERKMGKTKLIVPTSDVQRVKNSLDIIEADVKKERVISDKESALTINYKSGADMYRAGMHYHRVTNDAPKDEVATTAKKK